MSVYYLKVIHLSTKLKYNSSSYSVRINDIFIVRPQLTNLM